MPCMVHPSTWSVRVDVEAARDLTSPSLQCLPAAPTLSVQLQHERLGVRFVVSETFRELRVVHIVQIFAGRIAPGAPTERVEPAA